jgi:hypothetical protein
MALSNAERQRRYIERLKAKAAEAANAIQPGARNRGHSTPLVTNELSTQARATLKRLTRHWGCSVAALIERWATAAEHRVVATLKMKGKAALNRYRDGK